MENTQFCLIQVASMLLAVLWAALTVIKCFTPYNLSFSWSVYVFKIYDPFFFVFCSNNTLWCSLEEPNIVNAKEFEDLFSKAMLQPKKKPLSDTYEKKAKTKKVASFGSTHSPAWVVLTLGAVLKA